MRTWERKGLRMKEQESMGANGNKKIAWAIKI